MLTLSFKKFERKFLICVIIFGLSLLHFMRFGKNENFITSYLENNILRYEFAGGEECGDFGCFGSHLCGNKYQVKLNLSTVKASNKILDIAGSIEDHHAVVKQIRANIPILYSCDETVCKIQISEEMFLKLKYKAWICEKFMLKRNCEVDTVLKQWPAMKMMLQSRGRLPPNLIRNMSLPLTCTSSRLADRILRRVLGTSKGSVYLKDYSNVEKAQLLLLTKMSPSLMIQMAFPSIEGWLLERSYGSCGLITIHGASMTTTLFQIYHAPWKVRLDVAIQLLDLAQFYTENDSKYLLLLHRLTPHDLGISDYGKLRIQNAEEIIIVDGTDPKQNFSSSFETPYSESWFTTSESFLCGYKKTDINYYAVCNHFLASSWKGLHGETLKGGLLHDPIELSEFSSQMFILLDLCSRGSVALPHHHPPMFTQSRILAALRLRTLLAKKRACSPQFAYRYPECEYDSVSINAYSIPNFEINWLN